MREANPPMKVATLVVVAGVLLGLVWMLVGVEGGSGAAARGRPAAVARPNGARTGPGELAEPGESAGARIAPRVAAVEIDTESRPSRERPCA